MVGLHQAEAFRVFIGKRVELQLGRVVQWAADPLAVAAPHRQAVRIVDLRVDGVAHAAFVGAAAEHAGHRRNAQLVDGGARVDMGVDGHHHLGGLAVDVEAIGAGGARRVEHSREAIQWLIDQGVSFTRDESADPSHPGFEFHLTREGGHSHRRIIHAADATGAAIFKTLLDQARQRPNIELLEQRVAVDLITEPRLGIEGDRCLGAYVLNRTSGEVDTFGSRFTILATGGAAKVYLYTSNPDGACGDGIAMAWRSGCRVANLEFNQFHPTCLYHPQAKSFLITEALRGEGAHLKLPNGERFMHRFDPRGELAPRDIVARAIDHEMKRLGIDCVYLDISHQPSTFIKTHFPTVYERCLEFSIDITQQAIPVVPAAHYTCGGVMVDGHGRTDVPGLYAIGETSFTGLHGANRMASNSLLECFVYARSAAADILEQLPRIAVPDALPRWDASQVTDSDEDVIIAHNWDELRRSEERRVGKECRSRWSPYH